MIYPISVSSTPEPGNASSASQLAPGQKLFQRYTLVRLLGSGGMGVVWLAHDDHLDQDVALKFLSDAMLHDPNAVERLKKETRHSLQLTHPNIVRIYDIVQDTRMAAIAMEHIDGWPLAAIKVDKPDQCFTTDEILPWVRQLCHALTYAHDKAGIVHRDLKPGNLLIDAREQLKVSDFGLARNLRANQQTTGHAFVGTVEYMSPEQALGEEASVQDDIYSLGATIYELLSGTPPFYKGDILAQVRDLPPVSMTERLHERGIEGFVPLQWEETVAACLAKDPGARPQSAAEVLRRLESAPLHEAPSPVEATAKPSRKNRVLILAGASALVAVVFATTLRNKTASRPASDSESAAATTSLAGTPEPSGGPSSKPAAISADDGTPKPPQGFVALFNGKDFTGWHAMSHINPAKVAGMTPKRREQEKVKCAACRKTVTWGEDFRKHWRVENGEIVNDGYGMVNGPYATTDREFGDIELHLEYKMRPETDSGVYLRGTPQVQIWDHTQPDKVKYGAEKGSGGLWNNTPGTRGRDPLVLADKPFGEWNHFRIIQAGDITTVYLNDKLVVDHARMENYWDRTKPLFARGPVQLQTHGGEIRFRNIYLRELSPEESQAIQKRARTR